MVYNKVERPWFCFRCSDLEDGMLVYHQDKKDCKDPDAGLNHCPNCGYKLKEE